MAITKKSRLITKVGKRYGVLTVIEKLSRFNKSKYLYYKCRCDCGKERIVHSTSLNNYSLKKSYKKCSCIKGIDETGNKYGNLIVKKRIERDNLKGRSRYYWECLCSCGKTVVILGHSLRQKNVKQCRSCSYNLFGKKRLQDSELVGLNKVYLSYNYRANCLSYDFSLTKDEFYRLIKMPCVYCSAISSNTSKLNNNRVFKYNTLDRIDSKKGYIISNIAVSCDTCNTMKMDMTVESFLDHISKIYERNR